MTVIRVDITSGSREEAQELADMLQSDSSEVSVDVEGLSDERGLAPIAIFLIVVAGAVGVGVVTRIIDWYRDRNSCLLVVDARTEELRIEQRCDLDSHRGKTVIIANSETQISIEAQKGTINLDELVQVAAKASIESAVEIVKAAGGTAEIQPAGQGLDS